MEAILIEIFSFSVKLPMETFMHEIKRVVMEIDELDVPNESFLMAILGILRLSGFCWKDFKN